MCIRDRYRHRYAKRLHWRQGILLAEIAILFIVGFMPEKWNLPATIMVSFACLLYTLIYNQDLTDMTDILKEMLKDMKGTV